jgi:hypothetical protein
LCSEAEHGSAKYCQRHGYLRQNCRSATAIVTNSAASGKVFKVNSLYVANVDGTNNAEITADVFRSSTAYRLASTVVVPADATLTILSTPIYLEEGDSIRLTANANSDLEAVCSYEEISS